MSEMVESLFSNAVHEECMERLTERENYDLRFQIVVIQAPEAVRLSQSQDPWDIWILKHPAKHHFHPKPNLQVKQRTHMMLF